jgi:hypothetical protein
VLERRLGERVGESLAAHPGLVGLGPALLALAEDVPVPQQLLADAMAGGAARADQIVAAAHQVTQPFLLRCRRVHELQRAGAVQDKQPLGVTAVGLHMRAGRDRRERRRDDVARHPDRRQQPVGVIAARARLVADDQTLGPAQPLHQRADRALAVWDLLHAQRAGARIVGLAGAHDRALVNIERGAHAHLSGRVGANVRHGLVLLRMRLWPRRPP